MAFFILLNVAPRALLQAGKASKSLLGGCRFSFLAFSKNAKSQAFTASWEGLLLASWIAGSILL